MSRKRKIIYQIASVIAVIALIFVVAGLGETHFNPFSKLVVRLKYCESDDGQNSIICDQAGYRILILKDGLVDGGLEIGGMTSSMGYARAVAAGKGRIFADAGIFDISDILIREEIVELDRDGEKKGTLYRIEHSEEEYVLENEIVGMEVIDGDLYFARSTDLGADVFRISLDEAEYIDKFEVSLAEEEHGSVSHVDEADETGKMITGSENVEEIGSVEIGDAAFEVYFNDELKKAYINTIYREKYSFDLTEGTVEPVGTIPEAAGNPDGTELSMSAHGMMRSISFFFGIGYLVIYLIGLAVALIRRGHRVKISVVVIVAIVLGITFFFAKNQIDKEIGIYERECEMLARHVGRTLQKYEPEMVAALAEDGAEAYFATDGGRQKMNEISEWLTELCRDSAGGACILVGLCEIKDGEYYRYANNYNIFRMGEFFDESEVRLRVVNDKKDLEGYEDLISDVDTGEIYSSFTYYLNLTGNHLFNVYAAYETSEMYITLTREMLSLSTSLFAILIVIYVMSRTISKFRSSLQRYKREKAAGSPDARLNLSGCANFLLNLCFFADSVIIAYEVNAMCENNARLALYAAIPVAAISFGRVFGYALSARLRMLLGDRRTSVISSIAGTVSIAVMAFAVGNSMMTLFVIAKGVFGFFFYGILYSMVDTLPLVTDDHEKREHIHRGLVRTNLSASVLAIFVSGFLSQYLSYSTLYILIAIASAGMIFLCIMIFPKGSSELREKIMDIRGVSRIQSPARLLKRPEVIRYFLLVVLPFYIMGGYHHYLFPVLSVGYALPAVLTSNITLFTKAAGFYFRSLMSRFVEKMGERRSMVIVLGVISVSFILFLTNVSVFWAVIMMFIVTFGDIFAEFWEQPFLAEISKKYTFNNKATMAMNYVIRTGVTALSPNVIALATALGLAPGCAIIGGAGLILTGIYRVREFGWSIGRKPDKPEHGEENPST